MVYYEVKANHFISAAGRIASMTIENNCSQDGLRRLDPQVVGAIYDRYFPEIHRYIRYRVGDHAAAEDLASDVFVRLLESVERGRGPQSNLKGWLIGTASHIVVDHLRRRYRRPENELPESAPDSGPGPALIFDGREQDRLVQQAYLQLTAEQQNVLASASARVLLEETAAHMKKNVNAIKALQFRALASLQRLIGEVQHE
jgi:RNA polymerase sigma-70 factor (ECF subfamily)